MEYGRFWKIANKDPLYRKESTPFAIYYKKWTTKNDICVTGILKDAQSGSGQNR